MKNAEKKAAEVLGQTEELCFPVPVELIAERLGAKLSYELYEGDVSGMLFRDQDSAVIGINSFHSLTRQRFTIAHELGHLLLHEGKFFVDQAVRINLRDSVSSQATDQEEIEANAFAAELLMPRKLVEEEMTKRISKSNKSLVLIINDMASDFQVSPQAMDYRLKNLGLLIPSISDF